MYIAEAHACNEWPVGHPVCIRQPQSSEERTAVAQERLAELGIGEEFVRLVDDCTTDAFHKTYACWPFRWYTVQAGSRRLTSIAMPQSSGYDPRQLISWIVSEGAGMRSSE